VGAVDEHPEYWAEYTNLQHTKHELIRRYLGGWFPKLGTWAGRVVYLDTHAGRGRHLTGQLGSPLVALRTFLNHSYREQLLRKSEFWFLFIERDPENVEALKRELEATDPLPRRVVVKPIEGDAFAIVRDMVASLKQSGRQLAPAFAFIDPYGFKVPGVPPAISWTGQ
jgi:three-Cys-motif partner protein